MTESKSKTIQKVESFFLCNLGAWQGAEVSHDTESKKRVSIIISTVSPLSSGFSNSASNGSVRKLHCLQSSCRSQYIQVGIDSRYIVYKIRLATMYTEFYVEAPININIPFKTNS